MYYALTFLVGAVAGFIAGYLYAGKAVAKLKDSVGKL